MPRKKQDLLKKQKRLIATRLMQISLLVDDYLYQNKSMSQKSAAFYIKEISGYKDRCSTDVRSLQVIEKLNRCLKGIIHEQQELNGVDFEDVIDVPTQQFPEVNNTIQSPVYSTIDEDLTQLEEIDMDIRIHEEIQKTDVNEDNVKVNDPRKDITTENDPFCDTNKVVQTDTTKGNSNDITLNEKYSLNTELEVIDLCDNEIEELIKQNQTIIEPDFNIQNAISHLSIKDIEEALTPFSQDCSQSILDSYFTAGQENSVNPLTTDYEDVITVTTHHKPATDITNDKITKIVLHKKIATEPKIQMPEEELIAIQNINQQIEMPTKNCKKVLKPVPKKCLRNNDTNSKGVAAKAKIKITKAVGKPAQKKKAKVVKKKLDAVQTITQQPSQYEPYTTNKTPLTLSKQLDTETTGNKIQKKISDLAIYNNVTVNDLSWIENIRFVREIQSEEYESLLEHEIFWENFTLPNWNENDFNY